MLSCGLGDNAPEVECRSKVCMVIDLWIDKIDDKPLSFYACGNEEQNVTLIDDGNCKAFCGRDISQLLSIELNISYFMEQALPKLATDDKKLSHNCIKDLTTISSATYAYWTNESFNNMYCNDIDVSKNCNLELTSPRINETTLSNSIINGGTMIISRFISLSYLSIVLFVSVSF